MGLSTSYLPPFKAWHRYGVGLGSSQRQYWVAQRLGHGTLCVSSDRREVIEGHGDTTKVCCVLCQHVPCLARIGSLTFCFVFNL